jgi:hypothetical protein
MWQLNYDNTTIKDEHVRGALSVIKKWCDEHDEFRAIDPRRLVNEPEWTALELCPGDLTNALFFLVEQGVLKQVYRFEPYNQGLVNVNYNSLRDIPEVIEDRMGRHVSRNDGRVVPVFVQGPARA